MRSIYYFKLLFLELCPSFIPSRFVFTDLWHPRCYKSVCLFKLQSNTLVFVLSGNITARISRRLQVSEKRGLPFVARIEEEGNGMRQRRNRFICGKGKMKVYSINRGLWYIRSSQLPCLWPLDMDEASASRKALRLPLGRTENKMKSQRKSTAHPLRAHGMVHLALKVRPRRWRASLGLPALTPDMTSPWRARIFLKCNNINYQVTLKHVWCMCAFISQEWYKD